MNEAELVLSDLLGCGRPELYLRARSRLDKDTARRMAEVLRRRIIGEPLAYITGRQDFYGLSFLVTPDVLIPRQDTEVLVETVLKICRGLPSPRILEIGAGSGAVAVALAVNIPSAKVTAAEISRPALEVAAENIRRHGVQERVECLQCDLFPGGAACAGAFDLIVSNPPYIPSADIDGLEREVRREPRLSLDGGIKGLDYYRRICCRAAEFLKPGGRLALEIGFGQRQGVAGILAAENFSPVGIIKDYNGIDRVITAQLRGTF